MHIQSIFATYIHIYASSKHFFLNLHTHILKVFWLPKNHIHTYPWYFCYQKLHTCIFKVFCCQNYISSIFRYFFYLNYISCVFKYFCYPNYISCVFKYFYCPNYISCVFEYFCYPNYIKINKVFLLLKLTHKLTKYFCYLN